MSVFFLQHKNFRNCCQLKDVHKHISIPSLLALDLETIVIAHDACNLQVFPYCLPILLIEKYSGKLCEHMSGDTRFLRQNAHHHQGIGADHFLCMADKISYVASSSIAETLLSHT